LAIGRAFGSCSDTSRVADAGVTPDRRVRVRVMTRPGPIQDRVQVRDRGYQPPYAAFPRRCRCRRVDQHQARLGDGGLGPNRPAPRVIANTVAFASSLRSFRCADIDRAVRPAARRRSGTPVRDAAPAAPLGHLVGGPIHKGFVKVWVGRSFRPFRLY
jgi:hypothetical protein